MNAKSFGSHLILDYLNVAKETLEYPETLSTTFTKLFNSLKLSVENYSFTTLPSKACLYTYILCCGHCKVHLDLQQATCNFEVFLWGASCMDHLRRIEEEMCVHFGWVNCVTSILLQRGGLTQFFLNDTTHTGTVFKKFKFVHREKSERHEIRVYDTEELGRVLIVDGFIQFAEDRKDAFISAVSKDTLGENPIENTLVFGGGDLALLDYLAHQRKNIKNVVLLEPDSKLLEVLEKFFDFGNRFKGSNLIVENVCRKEFFAKNTRKFDCVIVDNCDVKNCGCFSDDFYKTIKETCNKTATFTQKLQDVSKIQEYQKKIVEVGGFTWIEPHFCEVPDHNTKFAMLKAKLNG